MFINFKLKFYRILFYIAYPVICLCCFFICNDRVFTQKQMMLQVIELLSEKLNDENILFIFEHFF